MGNKLRLVDVLKQEREEQQKNLYWWTQVSFSYNSNHMEGTGLTQGQTEELFDSGTYSTVGTNHLVRLDDGLETVNHFRALDWVLDHVDEPVSKKTVTTLQTILKRGTRMADIPSMDIGNYKRQANVIGGGQIAQPIRTASPQQVPLLMEDVFSAYKSLTDDPVKIAGAHWMFERIHPLSDGNGRVGRLVMFKECLRLNTVPPLVLDANHQQYVEALYKFPDEPGWLIDTLLFARDQYKDVMEQLIPTGILYTYNDTWHEEDIHNKNLLAPYVKLKNKLEVSTQKRSSR